MQIFKEQIFIWFKYKFWPIGHRLFSNSFRQITWNIGCVFSNRVLNKLSLKIVLDKYYNLSLTRWFMKKTEIFWDSCGSISAFSCSLYQGLHITEKCTNKWLAVTYVAKFMSVWNKINAYATTIKETCS